MIESPQCSSQKPQNCSHRIIINAMYDYIAPNFSLHIMWEGKPEKSHYIFTNWFVLKSFSPACTNKQITVLST